MANRVPKPAHDIAAPPPSALTPPTMASIAAGTESETRSSTLLGTRAVTPSAAAQTPARTSAAQRGCGSARSTAVTPHTTLTPRPAYSADPVIAAVRTLAHTASAVGIALDEGVGEDVSPSESAADRWGVNRVSNITASRSRPDSLDD